MTFKHDITGLKLPTVINFNNHCSKPNEIIGYKLND